MIKKLTELGVDKIRSVMFSRPVISVIGPPGDFSSQEKELLMERGFGKFKITDCLLKSETVAISIAAILKTKTYD